MSVFAADRRRFLRAFVAPESSAKIVRPLPAGTPKSETVRRTVTKRGLTDNYFAPKGPNKKAQGIALGKGMRRMCLSPERAK